MSLKIQLQDEEQQKLYTILVNEGDYHKIVVEGNLVLATELLKKQQEKENYKAAFQFIQNNFEPQNPSKSTSKFSAEALTEHNNSEAPQLEDSFETLERDGESKGESSLAQENGKISTHESTLNLIELCTKYEKDFQTGIKKYVWTKVAQDLSTKLKMNFTIQQCDTKWKGLKNTYKAVKKYSETSGNQRKEWKYFDLMNDILFNRPEIQAPATCSSRTGLHVLDKTVNVLEDETPSANNLPSETNDSPPSTSSYQSSFMRKRKTTENAAETRHREKMARQDRYLDLLERLTSAVERNTSARQEDAA